MTSPAVPRAAPSEDVVLRVDHLTKVFHDGDVDTQVLKGIDLEFRRGEFVAIMGPSGSGKSTLLSILGTLLRPTSGEVWLVGNALSALDDAEVTSFRNQHIGFVFQFHHLLPDFTALENVMFPALPARPADMDGVTRRAIHLLHEVGLGDRVRYKASKLSGGQKQRVAVARAVMNNPDIVLADEPTGNLDRESGEDVILLMRRLCAEEHMTFILSTHDEEIASRCDRVIHVVDGRIVP